jgi:hypothetical protein
MSAPASVRAPAWVIPDWPAPAKVRAAVSTRLGPGMSAPPFERFNLGGNTDDDPRAVAANRQVLCRELALPAAPHWLSQVHGTDVVLVDGSPMQSLPQADAAVTRRPGEALAILTADCLPALFCASDGSEVGAAHAGWRGLAGGVLEAALAALRTPPSGLVAWLGPCIGQASYEVGEEVRAAFVDADPGAAACFRANRPGHWLCGLAALARRRLAAAGVTRVHGGGFDTFADPRFYSWRRDDRRSGRFASLVWIEPEARAG